MTTPSPECPACRVRMQEGFASAERHCCRTEPRKIVYPAKHGLQRNVASPAHVREDGN